jgi:hypothetical protein
MKWNGHRKKYSLHNSLHGRSEKIHECNSVSRPRFEPETSRLKVAWDNLCKLCISLLPVPIICSMPQLFRSSIVEIFSSALYFRNGQPADLAYLSVRDRFSHPGNVLWPLLSGDSVNSDCCWVTPATYTHETVEKRRFFYVVRAEML